MFTHMIENNPDVAEAMEECGLKNDSDIGFIREQIAGPAPSQGYQYRDAKDAYLYEVPCSGVMFVWMMYM